MLDGRSVILIFVGAVRKEVQLNQGGEHVDKRNCVGSV